MPREGSGVRIVVTPIPLASRERSRQEDSHSGRVRTLGKRVKGNLSRVQIPHPPPDHLWITRFRFLEILPFSGMTKSIPTGSFLSSLLFTLYLTSSSALYAAESIVTPPKTQCFIEIQDAHISTTILE